MAVSLLLPLVESSHEVVAVVQNGRKTKGVKRWLLPMWLSGFGGSVSATGLAVRRGIPIVWIDRMAGDLEPLREREPDVLLVGGFNIILNRSLLDLPRIGCVNAHSSLLPKHRGPNPFCWAVLSDERESGVTFHIIDEGIDTGDILDQTPFEVGARDTALTVYAKACRVASERVVAVMDRIEAEGLRGTRQDHDAATYDKRPTEEDTHIDWTLPAEVIERRARAFRPLLMMRFHFRGRTVRVSRVEFDPAPVEAEPGTVLRARPPVRIATGQGTLIIQTAYCTKPIPYFWPAPWFRPKPGEKAS